MNVVSREDAKCRGRLSETGIKVKRENSCEEFTCCAALTRVAALPELDRVCRFRGGFPRVRDLLRLDALRHKPARQRHLNARPLVPPSSGSPAGKAAPRGSASLRVTTLGTESRTQDDHRPPAIPRDRAIAAGNL